MLAFPCNQFGKQEQGNSEQIGDFITGKLTDSNFSIFEKCHVNGRHTHPVWHFCRYNADVTRNRRQMFVIPWNFAKFIIDKEGRVFKYYSPKVPPSQIEPDIQALLANTVKAAPSQPRTIRPENAPPGFLSSREKNFLYRHNLVFIASKQEARTVTGPDFQRTKRLQIFRFFEKIGVSVANCKGSQGNAIHDSSTR